MSLREENARALQEPIAWDSEVSPTELATWAKGVVGCKQRCQRQIRLAARCEGVYESNVSEPLFELLKRAQAEDP